MERRAFLKTTVPGSLAASMTEASPRTAGAVNTDSWRAFEVTTPVEVLNPSGVTRAWIPLPLGEDTEDPRSNVARQ
jgi:hypothetical protein